MSSKVELFEVGPRDGLQNETKILSVDQKKKMILSLLDAGIREIEVGAFVRDDRVPQMSGTDVLLKELLPEFAKRKAKAWVLVPNKVGLERALSAGAKSIAFFTAASETFNQKNIGMSISQSVEVIRDLYSISKKEKCQTRAYLSTAFFCPYEGKIKTTASVRVIEKLLKVGIPEISIGDTIGAATPNHVEALLKPLLKKHKPIRFAVHFHDTRGTALVNAHVAYGLGIRKFDTSSGGLGGCPFAPGAKGNLATEDLLYYLDSMGIPTQSTIKKINFKSIAEASLGVYKLLERSPSSRVLQAVVAKREM